MLYTILDEALPFTTSIYVVFVKQIKRTMDILEKLRSLNESAPIPPALPTEADVVTAEEQLAVKFPPSYVKYQLHFSHVLYGHYELYQLFDDGSHLDLVTEVGEARKHHNLGAHLLPFVMDNGDYFCFDLRAPAPEYEVVYWSHNGITDERWKNFLDWVENCWIKESLEKDEDE